MSDTTKIDQLISEHFLKYMGDDGGRSYLLAPDDELAMPEIAVTELTPTQVAMRESTRLQLTQIKLAEKQATPFEPVLSDAFTLNPFAFKLLMFLNQVIDQEGDCQISFREMAERAVLTRETCRKAVLTLIEEGYMERLTRDQRNGNRYRVTRIIL